MKMSRGKAWLLAVLLVAIAGAALAQTVGGSCYATSCRAQDAATLGGSSYGHYSVAGYGGNTGGNCVGDGCQAGNGNTEGGTCYGNGCKAGNAWNGGGDCYGQGCTPGHGGTTNGVAHSIAMNTGCVLGEIYHSPQHTFLPNLANWNTQPGAACQPVWAYNNVGQRVPVQISFVPSPSPPPNAAAITPLPPNPWAPENLPRCPFTCQGFNPASGTCVGPAMNAC